MAFKYLFQQTTCSFYFAAIVEDAGPEGPHERMIRFDRCPLIEFSQCIFQTTLIHKNTSAVVARNDQLRRIQSDHALEAAQRPFVFAIKTCEHSTYEMNADVVWKLGAQPLNL